MPGPSLGLERPHPSACPLSFYHHHKTMLCSASLLVQSAWELLGVKALRLSPAYSLLSGRRAHV